MTQEPTIPIRLAEPQDIDAIHEMIVALAGVTNDESKAVCTPDDFLKFGFGAEPFFEALIAERDGCPVGLCLYFFSFSTWLGEPGVYVQDLYVADATRGSGLGLRLLQETAKRAHKRSATHLRLTVDHENIAARKFYDHIGMRHREDELTFHIGKEEFLAMAGDHE
jgi:GNAT superfamily N-acetyltransferase